MEQITEQIKKLENSIKIDPQNLPNYFELGSILVIIWLTVVGLWKYSSGGALISFTVFPIASWLTGQKIEFFVFSIVLSGIIILKHKENIQRLIDGTESRLGSEVK